MIITNVPRETKMSMLMFREAELLSVLLFVQLFSLTMRLVVECQS